jgi:biotin--protein ligase
MAPLNVLVYSGPGATALSTHQALHTLRSLLSPTYSVSTITPAVLLREPWAPSCALLVFPGGGDLGYCRALDGDGTALIRQYLRRGGRYLGFCAGGYFGSARCEFEVGRGGGMEVVGRRELALFPGTCCGGAFAGFEYQSEAGTRAARLAVVAAAASEGKVHDDEEEAVVYCNGGGVFVDADTLAGDDAKGVEVLARYAEDIAVDGGAGKAAIVYCKVGQGHAVLTGPHPEYVHARQVLLRAAT